MFEQRVVELGLSLPPEPLLPKGVRIPFDWVRVVGDRCVLSGHGALGAADGAPAGPLDAYRARSRSKRLSSRPAPRCWPFSARFAVDSGRLIGYGTGSA